MANKFNFKDVFTTKQSKKAVQISDSALSPNKKLKKSSKGKMFSIITAVILSLTHIAILAAIFFSYRYYSIYPELFGSLVAIVICVLIIVDIVFFVGVNHKDKALKIITVCVSSVLLICGIAGTYVLLEVNGVIDSILDDGSTEKYETVSGVFVTNRDSIRTLEDLDGKVIGVVKESSEGIASAAINILDERGIAYEVAEYSSNIDLLQALSQGYIYGGVFNSAYQTILKDDTSYDYTEYLEKLHDIETFERDIKQIVTKKTKDITKEPFNVLLIGWSRVEEGSTVGLADAIIVASVNPKTYTVSMMSIARDSYVEIPCYNNTKNKINSGRSTSRACFIETVEHLVGEEMDYYIEADYGAIVAIVNAVGGVEITNPVEFTLDGIYVPAGTYIAEGWQALEFCRERHAFAEGDFARQQHQKEVILAVARKFIESGDLAMPLNAMRMAGDYLTTDLTITQMTSMFNMILNTRNYTGLDTFDLLDFQTLRMTGYSSWFYSYADEIPLWIYKLYNGSVTESIDHMEYVLGNNVDISDQVYAFKFSSNNEYVRPLFYSLSYDEAEVAEEMPLFYDDFIGETYDYAINWSKKNNVKLKFKFITPDSTDYIAEKDGKITAQSPRYGQLVSNYPSGEVTVMGNPGKDRIPDLEGYTIEDAIEWADKYFNGNYKIKYSEETDSGLVYDQSISPYESIADYSGEIIKIYVYKKANSTSDITVGKTTENDIKSWINSNSLMYIQLDSEPSSYDEGVVTRITYDGNDVNSSSPVEIYPTTSGITIYISSGTKVNLKDKIAGMKNEEIGNYISSKYGSSINKINYIDASGASVSYKYYEAVSGSCDLSSKSCAITVKDNSVDVTGVVSVGQNKDDAVSALKSKKINANIEEILDANNIDKVIDVGNCTGVLQVGKACTIKVGREAKQYKLTVSYDKKKGSVIGAGKYTEGTQATLTATANEGYMFTGWSTGSNDVTISIDMNSDVSVSANFANAE